MKPPFRFARLPSYTRPLLSLGAMALPAGFLFLIVLMGTGGISGCKAVDLTTPADTSAQAAADSAAISVTNNIAIDSDSLILLLYSRNAVDVSNGALIKVLGGVGVGKTLEVKVPAGTWKLAYRNTAGNITPMTDINDGAAEWLKAIFVKNTRYSLILATDGRDNIWIPTFETDPEMQ